MKLTKKSKEMMDTHYNGYGAVFVKTGDKEITEIEFYLASSGKFYTLNGRKLTERLNELSTGIVEE